jgi:hypothetical protein
LRLPLQVAYHCIQNGWIDTVGGTVRLKGRGALHVFHDGVLHVERSDEPGT